jgi:sulfur carrier protein
LHVVINGLRREIQGGLTLQVLISSLPSSTEGRGVAVAVDGQVVPRGAWPETTLNDGARVEIVAAVQGG